MKIYVIEECNISIYFSIPRVVPSPSPIVKFLSTQRFNRQVDATSFNNNNNNVIPLEQQQQQQQQPWRRVPLPANNNNILVNQRISQPDTITDNNNINTGERKRELVSSVLNNDNYNFQVRLVMVYAYICFQIYTGQF